MVPNGFSINSNISLQDLCPLSQALPPNIRHVLLHLYVISRLSSPFSFHMALCFCSCNFLPFTVYLFPFLFCSCTSFNYKFCVIFANTILFQFLPSELEAPALCLHTSIKALSLVSDVLLALLFSARLSPGKV